MGLAFSEKEAPADAVIIKGEIRKARIMDSSGNITVPVRMAVELHMKAVSTSGKMLWSDTFSLEDKGLFLHQRSGFSMAPSPKVTSFLQTLFGRIAGGMARGLAGLGAPAAAPGSPTPTEELLRGILEGD